MDEELEIGKAEVSLKDIITRLRSANGVYGNDPITNWEEDSAKIELLTKTLETLKRNPKDETEKISRIMILLEVLRWARCDLGWLLLRGSINVSSEMKIQAGVRTKLN